MALNLYRFFAKIANFLMNPSGAVRSIGDSILFFEDH
jgi:hypothetical protein